MRNRKRERKRGTLKEKQRKTERKHSVYDGEREKGSIREKEEKWRLRDFESERQKLREKRMRV